MKKKLEDAVKVFSLLYSPEGQATFLTEETPCVMSVLGGVEVNPMIHDAQQALWHGRAFPMTYTGWEGVLADMGQAYKEWFRGGRRGRPRVHRPDGRASKKPPERYRPAVFL